MLAERAGDVEEDAQNIIIQSKINADAYNDKARNAKNQKYMSMFSGGIYISLILILSYLLSERGFTHENISL
jgi:hypothetical protein